MKARKLPTKRKEHKMQKPGGTQVRQARGTRRHARHLI